MVGRQQTLEENEVEATNIYEADRLDSKQTPQMNLHASISALPLSV